MRNARRVISAILLLLASASIYAQTPLRQRANQPRLAVLETVQFNSRLVGKTLPYNVILPVNYANTETRLVRYPVLYLLHGLMGHYGDWAKQTKLIDYATLHRLIIVMPEGNNGWYTDSATVPSDKYESYIIQELIPDVQRRYRTIENRQGRAVAGLSMGGYGALKFGLKYPEIFAFVASFSGAFGAPAWTERDLGGGGTALIDSVMKTFGAKDSPVRAANDIYKLVREASNERIKELPFIYLDCGTEDFLYQYNRDFADLLQKRKIPHEYRELPGTHNWEYWDRQIRDVLRIAQQRLSPPLSGGF
jgi:putative tributyrin esterase